MSLEDNIQSVSFASEFETDKIINVNSVSYDVTNSVATKRYRHQTDLTNDDAFAIGIFTYDGGTTWRDCGEANSPSGITIDPPINVQIELDTGGLMWITAEQTALVGGGATNPVEIRYALCAKDDQEPLTAQLNRSNSIYDSNKSYMKIAKQGTFTVGVGNNTTTIAHNLGYVPYCQVFYTNFVPRLELFSAHNYGNPGSPSKGVVVDTANLTIYSNDSGTFYYKIYYEA